MTALLVLLTTIHHVDRFSLKVYGLRVHGRISIKV